MSDDDWWGRRERLEYELSELDEAGFKYAPPDLDSAGPTNLTVYAEVDGDEQQIEVVFPELYPFFRFQARAPNLELEHHSAPDGTLCFIGRDPANWRPSDTLAAFLRDRLNAVVYAGRASSTAGLADLEERQAEPYSDYYPYNRMGVVFIDGAWVVPDGIPHGSMKIGFNPPAADNPVLQAAVLELRGPNGGTFATADERLTRLYSRSIEGRWLRTAAPPPMDGGEFASLVDGEASRPSGSEWISLPNGRQRFIAVTFPEESGWRDKSGTGWVFLTEYKRKVKKQKKVKFGPPRRAFLRAGRAGVDDLWVRAPELLELRDRKIAVFGLGCVGAPSALSFARSGCGRLAVIDGDYVDPGTVLRWPLGLSAAGLMKTDVVAHQIRSQYPYTEVVPLPHRLGFIENGALDIPSEFEVLNQALDGADLVYDATANVSVQYFLSEAARTRELPYLEVSGTQGGWGGMVVRIQPGETGCWTCLQHHQQDWADTGGEQGIPLPAATRGGTVQPQGCGTPTFLAAGFDMESIANTGVRAAIEMLTAYPMSDWDVLVIAFRDNDGRPVAPSFRPYVLDRHPDCHVCGGRT